MDLIPVEILQHIGQYLYPWDYLRFRMAFKSILPLVQRILPGLVSNLRTTEYFFSDFAAITHIILEFITPDTWDELAEYLFSRQVWPPHLHIPIKKYLKESRFNLRAGCNYALRWACKVDDAFLVAALLNEPSVNPADYFQHCIKLVSESGNVQIAGLLLQDVRVNPASNENYAIREACSRGHVDLVRMLLQDPRVDPTANENEAFRYAVKHGHFATASLLLNDPRVDPTSVNNEAMMEAVGQGNTELVGLLLRDSRIDPSVCNNRALKDALDNNSIEIVRLLLNDSRVDPSDEHIITQQVSLGHGQKVKILLEHPKVNVYVKRNKMNLLEWSAYLNRPTVVQVLLEDKRIDPKCNECNAFRIAARKGYYQIVELFLKDLRIDPSGYNNEAIVAAAKAKQGSCETIQVLLRDIRVDPNAQDNIAILNAAKKGHLKMVQTLVASDRVNAAGLKAAYATANCYSHPKVAQFLAKKLRL